MTCRHVVDLIDAGPFADASQDCLEAARQHARDCTSCGAALATSTALTTALTSLPQPAPPPELAAAVLARVARIEQRPVVVGPSGRASRRAPAWTQGWSAWATAAGGVGAGLATVLSTPGGSAALRDIVLIRISATAGGNGAVPPTTGSAVVLGTALVLYAVGLFASLREGRRA